MPESFDDILNKCIDRVLRGESPEQCLKDYPQQAAELKPLLASAVTARKATLVEPRPEFKAQARYQLATILNAQKQKEQQRRGFLRGWQYRWATVAIALLIFLLLGGGTVAASTNSLPDQPLYPVKLAAEQVQLTFAFSDIDKARLHAKFVDRRVKEIVLMAKKGNPEKVRKLALRLEAHLEKIKGLVGTEPAPPQTMQGFTTKAKKIGELRQLIQQNAARHRAMLLEAENGESPSALPEDMTNTLRASQMRYEGALRAMGVELPNSQQ